MDRNHVFMHNRCGGLCLARKSTASGRIGGNLARHHFNGDGPIQQRIERLEDKSHSATSYDSFDLIGAKPAKHRRIVGWGQKEGTSGGEFSRPQGEQPSLSRRGGSGVLAGTGVTAARLRAWLPASEAWNAGLKVRKLLGYEAGEKCQRYGNRGDDPRCENWYRHMDWGWDRETCRRIIAAGPG